MIKFIILSTQRTGSTFLHTSLNSHPRIESSDELFMPRNSKEDAYAVYRRMTWRRRVVHLLNRQSIVNDYLNDFFTSRPGVEAKGFKLMYGQVKRFPQVSQWCKESDVRVIHLIRQNLLKVIVSRKVAKERGVYHSTKTLAPLRIRVDCRKLIPLLREVESQIDSYGKAFAYRSYIEVSYESLVANQAEESERILRFLDLNAMEPLVSNLKKVNPSSLYEVVENYQEMRDTLRGTTYERFLNI